MSLYDSQFVHSITGVRESDLDGMDLMTKQHDFGIKRNRGIIM